MSTTLLAAALGLIMGSLVTYVVQQSRSQRQRSNAVRAEAERAAAVASATATTEQLQREREQHAEALRSMHDAFQVAATEALGTVVEQQSVQQEAILQQREAKLDDRLKPLADALESYRGEVHKMNTDQATTFEALAQTTARLTELQGRSISETERLNRILGREKDRGAWGENQLENILRLSGMEPYIDYVAQSTVSDESKSVRPDVVVRLPNRGNFAIDSKAPLAEYDSYLLAETPEQQGSAAKAFAGTVRKHVQQLATKGYQNYVQPSPDFVACFIPSDNVLTTALSGDQELWNFAIANKVLLCGPSSLMGMMWSVAYGWRQSQLQENASEILELSHTLHDRISVAYSHFFDLSRSLGNTVKSYNRLVDSMESRLLVTMRTMEEKGVKGKAEIKTVEPLGELPHDPTPGKWPQIDALPTGMVEAHVLDQLERPGADTDE